MKISRLVILGASLFTLVSCNKNKEQKPVESEQELPAKIDIGKNALMTLEDSDFALKDFGLEYNKDYQAYGSLNARAGSVLDFETFLHSGLIEEVKNTRKTLKSLYSQHSEILNSNKNRATNRFYDSWYEMKNKILSLKNIEDAVIDLRKFDNPIYDCFYEIKELTPAIVIGKRVDSYHGDFDFVINVDDASQPVKAISVSKKEINKLNAHPQRNINESIQEQFFRKFHQSFVQIKDCFDVNGLTDGDSESLKDQAVRVINNAVNFNEVN